MRGEDIQQGDLFSYGSLEERVPATHPLRAIRTMVDEALKEMSARFDAIYGDEGRRSIPPQREAEQSTHQSLTDPTARMYKKSSGSEAKLAYLGHVLTENRNGLAVDVRLAQAGGTAERDAALAMLAGKPESKRVTVGGDRGYDTRAFVAAMRELQGDTACGTERFKPAKRDSITGQPDMRDTM